MKNSYYYLQLISASALMALLVCLVLSCSDMDDNFEGYYKNGEITYAAKPKEIMALSGRYRVRLQMTVSSYRTNLVRVYMNNRADSFDIPITKGLGVYEHDVENLQEQGHLFQAVAYDEFGNKSLPMEVSARAYGDRYQQVLTNRAYKTVSTFENNSLTIKWSGPVEKEILSILEYTNTSGDPVVLELPVDSTRTILTDLSDVAKDLRYRTLFLPDSTAIDTFYTEYRAIPMIVEQKLSKATWSVVTFSSEEANGEGPPNGMVKSVFDDNLGSFWHTQWQNPPTTPAYPHWFILDLGSTVAITSFEVFRRQLSEGTSYAQNRHQFWYSNNGVDWILYGEFAMNDATNAGQKFRIEDMPTARYVKYVAKESGVGSQHAFLAEFNVYVPQ
jgi:hypothetical protein